MSWQGSITEDEAASLAAAGLSPSLLAPRHFRWAMNYYRAGFAAGRQQPEPRVFRAGDPEPGPEVGAVLDSEGDVWARKGDPRKGDDSWGVGCDRWTWVLQYGPLVGLPLLPDWLAAVKADGRHAGS